MKRERSAGSRRSIFALVGLSLLICGPGARAQVKWVDVKKDESEMTYRLVHPLHKIEATSKEVAFRVQLDPSSKEIKSVTGQVDVMSFSSGNSSRDSHAMEVIDALSYPEALFASTSVAARGDSVTVSGKLTFHGVRKDIVIPAFARWTQGKLDVSGVFEASLTAFGIERPSLLLIPVEDNLIFSFKAAFALE